jgi:hypothetical protein
LNPATYVLINKGVQSSQITCTSNLGLQGTITDGYNNVGAKNQALLSNGGSKVQWGNIPVTTISNTDNNLAITQAGDNYNINLATQVNNYSVKSDVLQSNA